VKEENWTQAQAADRFGVSLSRVSDLLPGKWDKFGLDMLITLAARAGRKVELAVA
jgi:predicted XRE-type DNA-binding protein